MAAINILQRIGRVARKSPVYVVKRLAREAAMEADRVLAPARARRITGARLAKMAGVVDIDALWSLLADRPFPAVTDSETAGAFASSFPDAVVAVMKAADRAIAHEIDLLGSGPVALGDEIDWLRDFVTGDQWEPAFCRSIDYVNRGKPSDVKRPWELSRMQWLIPVGQAFLLNGNERYPQAVREVIEQWIAANPYAWSVNWSCTMEPALRILTWSWLFHVFSRSEAWLDTDFRSRFLAMLYLHGAFTERHIERSTVNGNHLTADAAGLVFAGLFFEGIGDADRWASKGWKTLEQEIELQVHADGVDFEASTAYHRLVTELFLLPSRFRLARNMRVSGVYRQRLAAMARFASAYTRPDGTSPHWGDADDGRALPLGSQPLSDHRYLASIVGATFGDEALLDMPRGNGSELFWHCGITSKRTLRTTALQSAAFNDGGVYILADAHNHVFIDCGPVGLAGLGGHGHSDALSFEAWLAEALLIVDPGCYVYTSSFEERNAFRSTAYHNTPQVDGQEINRLYAPDNLWSLHDDARAEALDFETTDSESRFRGRHSGYLRLPAPVAVEREIVLDHRKGALAIADRIEGEGEHSISIPLHFAPGVDLQAVDASSFIADAGGSQFRIAFEGNGQWHPQMECARVSPRYGVAEMAQRLVFRAHARLPLTLEITVTPLDQDAG